MFGKREGKRFGITAVMVALSFFVGGLLTSAGFNGGQPAGATVPFVQSQPGSAQPVAESPFTALAGKLTNQAYRSGVTISSGTDGDTDIAEPWPALFDELQLLHDVAGMPPMAVLKATTINAAPAMARMRSMSVTSFFSSSLRFGRRRMSI
jgi:imidazolonepropionase-like amidohydrolase